MLIASCFFAVLTFETVERFYSKQTVIKVSKRRHMISEIYFPAVTICPEISVHDEDGKYK